MFVFVNGCCLNFITILVNKVGKWEGTATELLKEVNQLLKEGVIDIEGRKHLWPVDVARTGTALSDVEPLLKEIGIEVKRGRTGSERTITLSL